MALLGSFSTKNSDLKNIKASQLCIELTKFKTKMIEEIKSNLESLRDHNSFAKIKRVQIKINSENQGYEEWFKKMIVPGEENFGEVVNQLATIERMIALLEIKEFQSLALRVVHPTQTSNKNDLNHDLVLQKENVPVEQFIFEVSDVIATSGDTNKKLEKDLKSLYSTFLQSKHEKRKYYLVISEELYEHHFGQKAKNRSLICAQNKNLKVSKKAGSGWVEIKHTKEPITSANKTHVIQIHFN